PEITLSHSTLYRRIREDRDAGGSLYKRLPRFGKTRWKGGKRQAGQSHIPNRVDISQRPAIADKRARTGDFEGETIYGQNAYLVTLVDRKSRLLLMAKTQNRTAESVSNVMNTLLNRVSSVHTVTLDNGGEFARHEKVSQSTKAQIYFARPYASYQRGTNENTNGQVRRQWPKGTAFGSLTEQDVSDLELRLNMTPRKVLNGLTPRSLYGAHIALIVLIQPFQDAFFCCNNHLSSSFANRWRSRWFNVAGPPVWIPLARIVSIKSRIVRRSRIVASL
ncbi:IS30 family transposase, partial [Xenorhabdus sp. DI]|nr:IS30 family transposase [Xenorhabdus sp. 3]MBD2789510.1 IS30 family transposase [Xenorhabdus sp. DI]